MEITLSHSSHSLTLDIGARSGVQRVVRARLAIAGLVDVEDAGIDHFSRFAV